MKGLGVLVVGGGYGAKVHAPAFAGLDPIARVAVCGRTRAAAVESVDGKIVGYADWRAALARGGWSSAVVAVPPEAQLDIARTAASAGLDVLIEKPCGTGSAALEAFAGTIAGGRIAVGYGFRFVRGLAALASLARAAGPLSRIDVVWRTSGWASPTRRWSWRDARASGGGVIREFASHCFDYLSLFGQGEWRVVDAHVRQSVADRPDAEGRRRPVDVPDAVDATLIASSGARVDIAIDAARSAAEGHFVSFEGVRLAARWAHPAPFAPNGETLETRVPGEDWRAVALASDAPSADSRLPAAARQAAAFLGLAGGDRDPPPAGLTDAIAVWRLIEATEAAAA